MTMQTFTDGLLIVVDHQIAQYLFATTVVLALSSICAAVGSSTDVESYENAYHLLEQLRLAGNQSAYEFCHQLDLFRAAMDSAKVAPAIPDDGVERVQPTADHMDLFTDTSLFDPLVQDFLMSVNGEFDFNLSTELLQGDEFWPWPPPAG